MRMQKLERVGQNLFENASLGMQVLEQVPEDAFEYWEKQMREELPLEDVPRGRQALEWLRESPIRYVFPWGMTVARPIIGADAMVQAWRGNWGRATLEFAGAWATDFEGIPARWLHAVTKAGAIADPVADAFLRAESIVALAPRMPVTASLVAAGELFVLTLNAGIQQGRSRPFVPKEAKLGTVLEGKGIILAGAGLAKENVLLQRQGQAALLSGVGLRVDAYMREDRRMQNAKR